MPSNVDICNAALIKLGQSVRISALSEQTAAASVFNAHWSRVLDLVLEEHPWPFTVTAVALALDAQAAFPGWAYRYARPADCLTALAVCGEGGVRAAVSCYTTGASGYDPRVPFETVHGTQQTCLVTDLAEAYLVYAARVTDVSRFPPGFCEALACRLAMEAGPALAGELGIRLADKLRNDYEMARARAVALGFNESREGPGLTTPSLAARGGY